jgi:hypothetical protein
MPPDSGEVLFDGLGPIRYKDAAVNRAIESGTATTRVGRRARATHAGLLAAAVVGILAVGGCGRKIGDSCVTSLDCDPTTGTRICDLSQPGGYCVIEGCDARSCPEDSYCVRFFPEMFLTGSCSLSGANAESACAADEICVPAAAGEDAGVCARRALERRYCVQSCGGDGDCRGGYGCKPTGADGVVAVTLNPKSTPRFCAPK